MKNFQANLLIALALALCGLCAFQWHELTSQRTEIEALNGMVFQKNLEIQGGTNSIATLNHQLEQLDARITEIKTTAATNEQLVISQSARIAKLQFANLNLTNAVNEYRTAAEALSTNLNNAYAGIAKQNEAMTNLVSQRDEFVKKYNDGIKDRNEIVAKYNALVEQIQKQQNSPKP